MRSEEKKGEERNILLRHTLIILGISLPAIVLIIFFLDLPAAVFFNRTEMERVYYYSREITNIGYSIHYFAIALAGIVFSKLIYPRFQMIHLRIPATLNLQISQTSWFAVKVLILGGIPVHVIKMAIGRMRPHVSGNFNPLNFEPFNLHHHWHSFPSGHAQVLFSVATIALLIWPRAKYFFLLTAFFLALTRMTIHQHFFSDVLAGAVVGYLSTLWLHFYLWPSTKSGKESSRLS